MLKWLGKCIKKGSHNREPFKKNLTLKKTKKLTHVKILKNVWFAKFLNVFCVVKVDTNVVRYALDDEPV